MKSPVEMPDMYVALQSFEPQRVDYMAPEASGRIGGVQAGFPLWQGTWTLGRMTLEYSDIWRSWVRALRGSIRRFIGRDLGREYPRAYPSGFAGMGGFSGAASDWSQTINADGDAELTLTGLPAGFVLSINDQIDFRYTATEDSVAGLPWRDLVSVSEGGTADGSGEVTVVVEPPVPTVVPDTATAHLDKPGCIMVLIPDQTNLDAVDVLKAILGGQIGAIQDRRA